MAARNMVAMWVISGIEHPVLHLMVHVTGKVDETFRTPGTSFAGERGRDG
ncbi:MAG TPA: hypothetical protein GX529_08905 [Firmicutes bacterium]|nr:hypothetical protein [Candidatus Fermentithermobacillaceae bacterium]